MPPPPLYSPFKHRRDTRLLRIKAKTGKHIEVSLEVYNLDSNVTYTALSYVWDSPTPRSWIVCNGHKIQITYNLWRLLSQLQQQQQDDKRLLWADALCINQQDNAEKSIQVNMMRDIYRQAANVIFWLGPKKPHDKAAVRLMNVFTKNYRIYSDLEPLRVKPLKELGLPLYDRGWIGWASLLSRPWFGRIWIVQEFLNATHSVFMSGALEIPSNDLAWFAFGTGICGAIGEVVAQCNNDIRNNRDIVWRSFALGLDKEVQAVEEVNDTRLVDLWTRSQLLGATDPRDRVFALLSTQTAVSLDMINYDKDEAAVYQEIAEIALTIEVAQTDWYRTGPFTPSTRPAKKRERTSRFLACKTQTEHSSTLPSWVPDWRPAGFSFIPLTRYFPGTAWFTHSYSHASIDGKALFISGYIIDQPSIIVDSMPYAEYPTLHVHRRNSNNRRKTRSWIKSMLDWQTKCYLSAQSSRWTKKELSSAFCRTMAFNALAKRGATPDEEYIAGFHALRSTLLKGMPKPLKYSLPLLDTNIPSNQGAIYGSVFMKLSAGRKFAMTGKGDLAWVPQTAKLGDRVCFLAGCAVPFVIRPVGSTFELLGDCYLHSMMCDESITLHVKPQMLEFR